MQTQEIEFELTLIGQYWKPYPSDVRFKRNLNNGAGLEEVSFKVIKLTGTTYKFSFPGNYIYNINIQLSDLYSSAVYYDAWLSGPPLLILLLLLLQRRM